MATQKDFVLAYRFLYVATCLVILTGLTAAGQLEWQTINSFKEIRRMRLIDDTLWVATSGGLMAVTDADSPGRKYDNLDGLGTTDITDIIEDVNDQKWVTGFGRLIRFSEEKSKQFLFEKDNALLSLFCVVDDGDNLWIGTDSGLVLFSKTIDDGQIQDSYGQFGNLSANPEVKDILLAGDTIWIATSSGLAVAEKTNPVLLKSPAAWTVFGIEDYPELGSEEIQRIALFEGALYVATSNGMFRLDRSPGDTSFAVMPIGIGQAFSDLKIENDSLFFYYNGGMGVVKDSTFSSLPTGGLPSFPFTGANNGAYRWVGHDGDGIYQDRDSLGLFVEYPYTGGPGNNISGITVNAEGLVTAGFTERPAAQYNGEAWTVYDAYDFRDQTLNVILDSSGNAWVGTWGNGVWFIGEDTVVNYDETNSTMRGIGFAPRDYKFVIVRGLATDGRYLYAACYRVVNGYPVAIGDLNNLDSPSGWDSLGIDDGLTNEFVNSIDCHQGRLAVGTIGGGIYMCYIGDDPFDSAGRYCRHYTVDSGLVSNNIRAIRFAPDGNLWVGTDRGLSRWDLDRFVDVTPPEGIGPVMTALEFDGRNNLWLGSERTGLARVDGATGASAVYTARNSGLVSNAITDLALHPVTGDLYVATSAGISILQSGVSRFTSLLDDVVAFPNPFVIRSDRDNLKFNYSKSASVRIFTVAGELVAEFPINTPWNGRNQKGRTVASGVYLFVLTDEDGNVGKGKVLVVRE